MRVLIAYCTRYGATTSTSEKIALILKEEGFDVKVTNAKEEKIKDISEYDLIIVGAGLKMMRWCKEAENFLKKFHLELGQKKVAIFVSSGGKAPMEFDGQTSELEELWQKQLVEKALKYNIDPIALGMFGGVWDFNKMSFIYKKTLTPFKIKLREMGIEENPSGVFDTRDWDEIRNWTGDLVEKVRF